MSKLLFRQIFTYWQRVPFLYQFSEDYVQRKHALTVMHGESKSVIKMKRDRMKAEEDIIKKLNTLSDEPVLGVKRRFAFLDFLLKLQRESECLTDADIQEEVNTFMFAVSIYFVGYLELLVLEIKRCFPVGNSLGSRYYWNWNWFLHILAGATCRSTANCIRGSSVR